MARHEGNISDAQHQLSNTLSDGLERLMKTEGDHVAPERTEVSEDQERMARPFELSSNSFDVKAAIFMEMARHEGNASNALFETLSDWEVTLRHSDIQFDDPFDGMEP